jgi:hypothetical protein
MAKSKLTLDIEYDYDFALIGISCHARDYRLCWSLNKFLYFNFLKVDDVAFTTKKNQDITSFSRYTYNDEDQRLEYTLLSNRGSNDYLLPEQKKLTDFILKIEGQIEEDKLKELINALNQLEIIQLAFNIEVDILKSKQNLIF